MGPALRRILSELEHPELLYLAHCCLHDLGKGTPERIMSRPVSRLPNRLGPARSRSGGARNCSLPHRNHLEISATLRRDIFDPETIGAFAEKVETPERLKMLACSPMPTSKR